MKSIKLSPSSLNLFLDCPRCFWLDKIKDIKRPRGIFPSLPIGMDLAIKKYFDEHRLRGTLPKELEGKVKGKLFPDMDTLTQWRNWRSTDLCYEDKSINAVLVGAIDDCLIESYSSDSKQYFYIPLDYKTRCSELTEDPRLYYQTQLDCYCLMLESRGFKTKGIAYLIYYWPEQVRDGGMVKFHIEPIKIETDINSAKKIVRDAAILLAGPIPEANCKCEYCGLVRQRNNQKL